MKTVVSVNEIAEFEIKPQAELEQWKNLVKNEIRSRWNDSNANMHEVVCPICTSNKNVIAFEKVGFKYVECNDCKTIYAKNRPISTEITWWYRNSKPALFWKDQLLKLSATKRKAKIIEPRAQWILDGISEYFPNSINNRLSLTDISFFGSQLIESLDELSEGLKLTSSGILAGLETYQYSFANIQPIDTIDNIEILPEVDILVAIDFLDRVKSIKEFFAQLENIIKPGGIFFATCPVSSGFEIQSLWDKSPSIIPPDKLNLPSINGLMNLFSNSDKWEILELSTPGMFDVESVRQVMKIKTNENWPRNLHALLDNIDNQGIGLFTEYLQSQRLSSFARLVIRRLNNKIY